MTFGLSPSLVKRSLAGHSWLGLLVGAPMYLICLSGTLAVFMHGFGRWEQPAVTEYHDYDATAVERGYNAALARATEPTHHMFVRLPTDDRPRVSIASDHGGWFINQDGSLGDPVRDDWTDFLVNLHLYLHLPANIGLIVVSMLGALLCGLIISGFVAHPRILKDAFNLRLKGARRLEQADIHNRLSVWGAPFHLMIAVTGAYFGIAGLMAMIFASAYFGGDRTAAMESVFSAEPHLSQPVTPAAVGTALRQMPDIAPEATPFYVTVEDVGTPGQYIIVGASLPGRLIYAEQYKFDAAGRYLDKAGFSDGAAGRQTIFSVYRIHFGSFGGFPIKVLYGILGLALTVVSVTGINIWLAKRKHRDAFNNIWTGIVWGTPAALALSALAQVIFGVSAKPVFWIGVLISVVPAQVADNDRRTTSRFQAAGGILLIALVAGYFVKFAEAALSPLALGVNGAVFLAALVLLYLATGKRQTLTVRPSSLNVAP